MLNTDFMLASIFMLRKEQRFLDRLERANFSYMKMNMYNKFFMSIPLVIFVKQHRSTEFQLVSL